MGLEVWSNYFSRQASLLCDVLRMSSSVLESRNAVGIQRGKMLITDIESLKKTEINRRRRLRLEQVRQQSKDVANQIRQRVRGEQDKQRSSFEQQQNADIKRLQTHKLLFLQQQYQDCLDEVGLGHMQAALQPDAAAVLEAENQRNQAQAEDRGREANLKLRLELANTEKSRNASRKQHKFARTVEDLRSAVVASLGKNSPKKRQLKNSQPLRDAMRSAHCTCGSLQCTCSRPQTEMARTERIPPASAHGSSKCGEDTDITSSDTSDASSEKSCTDVSRVKGDLASSTKVEQSTVQFYDHGNRFANSYPCEARVERVVPHVHELDAIKAAELLCESMPVSSNISHHRQARGQQALVRERLHRDYRQLLGDLHALAREERLIRSTREHGLPTEIFRDDYRRKELCTKQQRNMDLAFERIYNGIQQDSSFGPSSRAETVSRHRWEAAEQDSPVRLNVADCQLRQNGVSPLNSISSVAPSRDSVDIHPTAGKAANSEKKTYTLEDLVEQVNIQHSLLMDEKNVPQEWLPVPENHMMSSDQSSDNGSSSMALLSVHEDEPEVLAEQKKSSVDYEKHSEREIEERRSLDYDEGRENEVTSSGRRETVDHEEEETSHLQVEFGKHGVHTESRESDAISTRTSKKWNGRHSKGKTENENDKRENLVAEVDKGVRRGDTEVVRDNDSVTVLSEYSFDVSVCETREHSVESSLGSSTSSSYEGVKIVVSVSEQTEKKYKSGSSPEKTEVICCKSSAQKEKRYDALGQKICRQKHRRTGRGSRDVKEKATMTTESELKEPSKREPGVVAGKGETERIKDKDRTEMWHHVTNRTVISDKDMSEDSTSYMSPPDHLVPSHIQYLGKLLAAVHECQKKGDPDIHEINPQLALYISRLLAMSRESVERLGVSTSDVSTPDVETSTAGGIYAKSPCAAAEHSTKRQKKERKIQGNRCMQM
ncbi:uncharacterized protein LOC110834797 [Zootermopsis nevadensis]|uniref:Leucine-rich repeat-containing protein n=1 Tax=Zootermopsis nevadensis TaxID=136037 RepID=A0A067QV76_ZOONE|nr:uncharacterized protein LOC110834797 [Zootermopsis nevadensis]KDR14093.1 Leucine-rich repeat-containing protein [Zootermopsis nevadensis]